MKSLDRSDLLPTLIFSAKASGSSSSCEAEESRLFRLGNTLSSMMTAETPIRSRWLSRYSNCGGSPPVSPSTISGLVVTCRISLMVCNLDSTPMIEASGSPLVAESVRLLSQMPSNSTARPPTSTWARSAMRALRPLCASMIRTDPCRSSARLRAGRRSSLRTLLAAAKGIPPLSDAGYRPAFASNTSRTPPVSQTSAMRSSAAMFS